MRIPTQGDRLKTMLRQNRCLKALLFPLIPFLILGVTACSETFSDTGSGKENSQTTIESSKSTPVERESAVETENLTGFVLALSVDGLFLVDEQSGKTRAISFDTDIATSITAVSSVLGKPTETSQNSECPAGAMSFITWSNGLTMNAIDKRFVGWTVRRNTEGANLTTMNGIGLGKTLTDLKENYSNVEVMESTLGTEFVVSDSLSGLLSANKPNGVITNLWSGIACNFR